MANKYGPGKKGRTCKLMQFKEQKLYYGFLAYPIISIINPSVLFWDIGNSIDPDQNAASDQGLYCLLTECSTEV